LIVEGQKGALKWVGEEGSENHSRDFQIVEVDLRRDFQMIVGVD